jgi:hypothetical protein
MTRNRILYCQKHVAAVLKTVRPDDGLVAPGRNPLWGLAIAKGENMRIEMPALADMEIRDKYEIRYKDHVYIAYEVPDDDGHACGRDEAGRSCELQFVWSSGCWIFVSAKLAEHEKEA